MVVITDWLWTYIYSILTWQQKDGVSSLLCSTMCIPETLGLKNLINYQWAKEGPWKEWALKQPHGFWAKFDVCKEVSWDKHSRARVLRFKSTDNKWSPRVDWCRKGITITILQNSKKVPLPFCKKNIPTAVYDFETVFGRAGFNLWSNNFFSN